ncbi:MAG: tRNA glutamyl-Q(34) synthetase GluQRS [Candidatus Sumerlaeia bacterium]
MTEPAIQLPPPIRRDRPVGRYAPSPTGDLHLGNLRTALVAWESIRRQGGIFILRVEDIDRPRTVPGAEERMLEDLRWLGMDWDEGPDVGGPAGPYRQSDRDAIYEAALARLTAAGLTYPCFCSRRDLKEASAPHGEDGPVHRIVCCNTFRDNIPDRPEGATTRFRVEQRRLIEFVDRHRGPQRYDLDKLCGDFVIRRRDGLWAYQLACAVDDGLMGVTEVVRGGDLLSSTPRQIALLRALGLPVPQYEHIELVADAEGRRMCKRDGSCSLRSLREQGISPEAARALIMNQPIMNHGDTETQRT